MRLSDWFHDTKQHVELKSTNNYTNNCLAQGLRWGTYGGPTYTTCFVLPSGAYCSGLESADYIQTHERKDERHD